MTARALMTTGDDVELVGAVDTDGTPEGVRYLDQAGRRWRADQILRWERKP